jgi:hypothetical protein
MVTQYSSTFQASLATALTGEITVQFIEAAVERMFNADEVPAMNAEADRRK